jgi:hypothetical protein
MHGIQAGFAAAAILAAATAGGRAAEAVFPQFQCTDASAAQGLNEAKTLGDVALFYTRFGAAVTVGQCSIVSDASPKPSAVKIAAPDTHDERFPPPFLFRPRR